VLDAAISALPPGYRRRLMITCGGASASHGLIERLDQLASRPGHQLIYSVGWELGKREKAAISQAPEGDRPAAIAAALRWLEKTSLPVSLVGKPQHARAALDAISVLRNGQAAGATTDPVLPWSLQKR
jgi:hypothetical protein